MIRFNEIAPTFLILTVMLMGCANSMMYSPSLGLPHSPLAKNTLDLQAGAGLFPETRPHLLDEKKSTWGANGQFSFGVTDRFTLSAKAWTDIERLDGLRSGLALSGQFARPISDLSQLIFIPRVGFAVAGLFSSGMGMGFSTVYQQEIDHRFSHYIGLGSVWGWTEGKTSNGGVGLLAHYGVSCQLPNKLWFNLEVNPVYQLNYYENKKTFIVSPTLSIGYRIDN